MSKENTGRWIDVTSHDGKTFGAYLAMPPTMAKAQDVPGIVLIQEIWGVNAHIRAVADQYAADGFMVLAPDVFWRMEPRVELDYDEAGTAKAYGFRKGIDLELADEDVKSTVAALRAMQGVDGKVAAIGYCMGGLLSFRAAAKAGVDVAVPYYGGGIHTCLELAKDIQVPLAFHYGEQDTHITPDMVEAVRVALAGHDHVDIHLYPAGHGFNCWGRTSFDRPSALLAHGRTLTFLAKHLQ